MKLIDLKIISIVIVTLFLLTGLVMAQDEDVVIIDSEMVAITVSEGMAPTFSWTPGTEIGRLLVMQGAKELWGSETEGENIYGSPIRYGVHPEDAVEPEPAWPLTAGETYTVKLFRWISLEEEKFQLMGETEFTPSGEFEGEEGEAVAGLKPMLRINPLPPNFKPDGIMDETWQSGTEIIADLTMVEPEEGGQPEGESIIKVFADTKNIVVLARLLDETPDEIVAYSKSRDSNLDEEGDVVMFTSEDHILLVFDTFLDGRSGYVFAVNAEGARFDGLVIEQGEDVNREWDTIWQAKTSRDSLGWYVEIMIPIDGLSFDPDLDTWGFNVQRRVQRLQELSRWSGISLDFDIYQANVAGLLTGLPKFDFGIGLSVRPSLTFDVSTPETGGDTEFAVEPSLDVTQKIGANLLAALTVNTDFAETEVDVRQINLTRFPVFFPEKRTFFLEGSDIFEFGVGLDQDNLIPFYSRRIGLFGLEEDNQSEIPINVGGKINGRVGNTNIGALVVNTREVDSLNLGDIDEDIKVHVPQTTMGSVRISQNLLEQSSVGMIGTFGDQLGRSNSWSAGVDLTYRTQEFMDEKNFTVGVWGLVNDREDLNGDKSAYGFRIDYPNDLIDINFSSVHIGDGYDPSLSFVPRNGIHIWDFGAEYNPRPSWTLIRQMFHELSMSLYNNQGNTEWESYEVTIKPIDWLLESGDRFEATIQPEGDRPPEPFEISSDLDIPAGSYEWMRYILGFRFAEKRQISGGIKWETGTYYNGDLNTIEARIAIKPSALFTLEFNTEYNSGTAKALPDDYDEEEEEPVELTEQKYTERLYGIRFLLNFTPDLQLSSLTQYETESGELGSNNRLRWTFDPYGDIFIVYNHNLLRNREDKRWEFVSNQLPVKIQYTWRF
jgi:hypothetical protein